MPGVILEVRCPCGYYTRVDPGFAEFDSVLREIAYTSDGSAIDTFTVHEIEEGRLKSPSRAQIKTGTADCPKCRSRTLSFRKIGNWD